MTRISGLCIAISCLRARVFPSPTSPCCHPSQSQPVTNSLICVLLALGWFNDRGGCSAEEVAIRANKSATAGSVCAVQSSDGPPAQVVRWSSFASVVPFARRIPTKMTWNGVRPTSLSPISHILTRYSESRVESLRQRPPGFADFLAAIDGVLVRVDAPLLTTVDSPGALAIKPGRH